LWRWKESKNPVVEGEITLDCGKYGDGQDINDLSDLPLEAFL